MSDRGLSRYVERSLGDIARELGVTHQRVSQIEREALAKLRRQAEPLRSALEEEPCSPDWLPR